MTKNETRELQRIALYIDHDMHDTAARGLSAMIRATLSRKTSFELMQYAIESGLIFNENFLVAKA